MTITIELTQEQESYVVAIARQRGMTVRDLVAQMIDAHIGPDVQPRMIDADQDNHLSTSLSADDETQHRLQTLLQDLLARSDAVERQSGRPSAGASESPVAEAIQEKYRAQGLQV
jgi:hypothetical protein